MRTWRLAAIGVTAVVIWLCAVALVAAYYVPGAGFRYGVDIEWRHVLLQLPAIGVDEIRAVLGISEAAFWLSIVSWYVLLARRPSQRRSWIAALVPAVLLFPLNLAGVVALPFDLFLSGQFDGEFLAEHRPINYSYAVWTLVGSAFAVRQARHIRQAGWSCNESQGR
jgi:hypothetical protein